MKSSTRVVVATAIAAAAAVLGSVPASAQTSGDSMARVMHDREPGWPGSDRYEPRNNQYNDDTPGNPSARVSEPGMLALLALGLGGLALSAMSRRRRARA